MTFQKRRFYIYRCPVFIATFKFVVKPDVEVGADALSFSCGKHYVYDSPWVLVIKAMTKKDWH